MVNAFLFFEKSQSVSLHSADINKLNLSNVTLVNRYLVSLKKYNITFSIIVQYRMLSVLS